MSELTQASPQDEALRLRNAIRALVRRFSVSERADVSCCGMTVAQAATLDVLRVEGAMGLGELKRRLGITASTLSRNLARLEERGLVRRTGHPTDGRAVRAELTEAGRRSASELERQHVLFARSVLDQLPGHRRRAVRENLEALLAAVRKATESCCGGVFDHLMDPPQGRSEESP